MATCPHNTAISDRKLADRKINYPKKVSKIF